MNHEPKNNTELSDEIELLQARLDWVPDWIWEINLDAVITYSNQVVKTLLGYTPDEIVGRSLLSLLAEPDVGKCRTLFDRAVETGEPVSNAITHFRTKASKIRKIELSCVLVFDAENRLAGFRGIARDITDHASAERTAQEAEANYRVLVENSQTGIFIVQNGILVYANPTICELMGYPSEEVLGTSIMRYVHSEDAVGLATYEQRRIAGEAVPTHYAARGITKSGDVRYFEFRASVIGFGGAPAVLLNAVDITESRNTQDALRKSEQEYRDLVEDISDWVWQVDENAVYTYASRRIHDLLGYEPEEVLGKSAFDLMPPDDAKRIAKELQPVWDKHEPFTLLENPMVHRDGHIVWVETSGEPIFDEQNVFRGYRGIDRDITERKQAEAAIRASEEQYKTLFDNSPLPLWVFSLEDLTFLAVNEAMLSHYGYAKEELIGKSIMDIRSPEEAARLSEHIENTRRHGFNVGGIWKHIKKDGTLIDVEITSHTLEWQGERAVMILANDVTERLQAEEQLRRTTSEMETVFHAFPDLYFWVDAEDRIVNYHSVDPSELYVGPEAFLGKTFPDVLPEDVGRILTTATGEVRRTGSLVAVEYPLRMPGGKRFYEARLLPLPGDQVIVIARNITERKLHLEAIADSEERYRQLFEHSPDMVFLVSAQTNAFIAMNPAITRILGYATHEIIGKAPWEISPEFQPDGQRSEDKAKSFLRSQLGNPPQLFEWIHKRKDGSLIECEVSLVYYRFHGEDLIQAIVRDITDRKHAEETRRGLQRDLDAQKRSFYRETILSVTDGKLNIGEQADVEPYITRAIKSVDVNEYSEVAVARRAVEEFVLEHGITGDREDAFMVGVGEAITNAVKHGVQGRVYVGADEESVWAAVSDKGTGIESLILPRAVLLRGFSTKPSLGMGYSIMLDVCDRILLNTGAHGTTVVLIKEIVEQEMKVLAQYLPDTWDNVPG